MLFKFSPRDANDSLFRNNKKTLVNKFEETSPIVQLIWNIPTEITYGLKNGVIKVGNLRSNVSQILYSIDSQLIGISMSNNYLISAHSNGQVQKYSFGTLLQEPSISKFLQLHAEISCVEAAEESLAVGLCDENCGLLFFDDEGKMEVVDVNTSIESNQTITTISKSPNGDMIAVGYYDRFDLYNRNTNNNLWTHSETVKVENMLAVTSFGWSQSGSQLLVGSSSGLLNVYSTKKRQYHLHDEFQITHMSLTDVLIKRCNQTFGRDYHITSRNGEEILGIEIISSLNCPVLRYVVARTNSSLILSDLNEESKVSQFDLTWTGEGKVGKLIYIEEDSNFCLVNHTSKVHIVEIGGERVYTFDSKEFSSFTSSLRFFKDTDSLCFAYLKDEATIAFTKIRNRQKIESTIYHSETILFLELDDDSCKFCLALDKKRDLLLLDLSRDRKKVLLSSCSYAQFVPKSCTIVAKSEEKNGMNVWYTPSDIKTFEFIPIEGNIKGIEREGNDVRVQTRSGHETFTYSLDKFS